MSVCELRRSEKMSVTTEMNDLKFALHYLTLVFASTLLFVTLYLTNQTFNL